MTFMTALHVRLLVGEQAGCLACLKASRRHRVGIKPVPGKNSERVQAIQQELAAAIPDLPTDVWACDLGAEAVVAMFQKSAEPAFV